VSVLGHPALVSPAVVAWAAYTSGLRGADLAWIVAVPAGLGALVLAWSAIKVRRGRWAHPDASAPGERADLNRGLLLLLAVFLLSNAGPMLFPAVAGAAGIILTAIACERRAKLSHHLAFCAYPAVLLAPDAPMAAAVLGLLGAALAWSRLVLRRHAPRDLWLALAAALVWGLAVHALEARVAG
jgi:hypothetical protein